MQVQTMCFHTRDAVERRDSEFVFDVPFDRRRHDPLKVALASCEFPMTQWTIEPEWNRVYLNEGIHLDSTCNFLEISIHNPTSGILTALLHPPKTEKSTTPRRSTQAAVLIQRTIVEREKIKSRSHTSNGPTSTSFPSSLPLPSSFSLPPSTSTSPASVPHSAFSWRIRVPPRLNRIVSAEVQEDGWLRIECADDHGLTDRPRPSVAPPSSTYAYRSLNASQLSASRKYAHLPQLRLGGDAQGWGECDVDVLRVVDDRTFVTPLGGSTYTYNDSGTPQADVSSSVTSLSPSVPSSVLSLVGEGVSIPRPILHRHRNATHLLCTIASHAQLCAQLTANANATDRRILDESVLALKLNFTYDAPTDRIVLSAVGPNEGTTLHLAPTPLARACGLSSGAARLVDKKCVWHSEPTAFWDYVELPPGHYLPSHRPMSVGQPHRFGPELEGAANRLYFPLVPAGGSPHLLVFSEVGGAVLTCEIPPGRYTPLTLSTHLQRGMNARRTDPTLHFSVDHLDNRFVFRCERKIEVGTEEDEEGQGAVENSSSSVLLPSPSTPYSKMVRCYGVPFGLLFHHPLCVDASRFGFGPHPLAGQHTYIAPAKTRVPRRQPFRKYMQREGVGEGSSSGESLPLPFASNLLRVAEISSLKKFRLHGAPLATIVAALDIAADPEGAAAGVQTLRTYVNGQPFAHGFQVGDVVRVMAGRGGVVQVRMPTGGAGGLITSTTIGGNGVGGTNTTATAGNGTTTSGSSSGDGADVTSIELHELGLANDTTAVVEQIRPEDDACTLRLSIGSSVVAADGSLTVPSFFIRLGAEAEPWNLHFGKVGSVPADIVGFDKSAVQWGIHGSVDDGRGVLLPPYDAPHCHSLDHPDYVLITFSESSGANFVHSYAGEHRQVFCKLTLYPMFREERMLPRDTLLLRDGSGITRFTIAFWNPDMRTPYHFHGAQFSFSLTFVAPLPPAMMQGGQGQPHAPGEYE